jgi:threonine/homoserine/homoserine lactone efflux protein
MPLPYDLLVSLVLFVFVVSITPGPNNVIALSSGANFGFKATMPFMAGVALGFPVLALAVALGLGALLTAVPWLAGGLKLVGCAYLLWLAWKIATAGSPGLAIGRSTSAGPIGFLQSCLLQWVNPKAWIIAIGGLATYVPADHYWFGVATLMAAFVIISWPSLAVWTVFGTAVGRRLNTPARVQVFNLTMALMLVGSLWPILRVTLQNQQ